MTLEQVHEFIKQSNAIEGEFSDVAFRNAFDAWQEAVEFDELTGDAILEIHYVLMRTLRPDIAGHLRTVQVTVGGRLCPEPVLVNPLLLDWLEEWAGAYTKEAIKKAHIVFEKIHPFEDGNGRVGRIIMNWQRIKAGFPLLIIHTGKEQQDYYSWFK